MVFWAYGDQLVVLVDFHKTTVTTQTYLWSHFLKRDEKELHHIIQCLACNVRSYAQKVLIAST